MNQVQVAAKPAKKKCSSVDTTITKIDDFMCNVLQIMEKKSTHHQIRRKIALMKIAQLFVKKALVVPQDEVCLLTSSTSDLLHDTTGLAGDAQEAPIPISPSHDAFPAQQPKSIGSVMEEEFDDLSVLLFEEANKFVAEERKKQQRLQDQVDQLQRQLSSSQLHSYDHIYASYSDLHAEHRQAFKLITAMESSERIFIDGYFLADFQEFLAKHASINPGAEDCRPEELDKVFQSAFCKRILTQLVDPIMNQFKTTIRSNSQRKRLLECIQTQTFTISRTNPTTSAGDEQVQRCHLCGFERICEFGLTIEAIEISSQPLDRFCAEKLATVAGFYSFISECLSCKPFKPLLVMYRSLVRCLHKLSGCHLQGVVVSTHADDRHYPNIEILN